MTPAEWSALWSALRADSKRWLRDRFLVGMFLYVVLVSFALRWALPWIERSVSGPVASTLLVWVSYVVLTLGPMMVGILVGFLLLEAREEQVLRSMRVTPFPLRRYSRAVGAACALLAFCVSIVQGSVIAVGLPDPLIFLGAAAVAACTAPSVSLLLASVARDKVQAFAALKVFSALGLLPLAVRFLPPRWHPWALPLPYFAPMKAFWLGEGPSAAAWVGLGAVPCILFWWVSTEVFLRITARD